MLLCIWSAIGQKWCQNVVWTKKVAKKAQLSLSLILLNHILISFIIYSWTDPQQQGIYLFYIKKRAKYWYWWCHIFICLLIALRLSSEILKKNYSLLDIFLKLFLHVEEYGQLVGTGWKSNYRQLWIFLP